MELFSTASTTVFALVAGFIFGFLLRKGSVSRFDTIIGQLLLKDFTVMKVMFTAIVVGSIGIFALNETGHLPTFHLSTTATFYVIIGAAIFGVGMSITGYCPGTALAALGEGAKDMIFGLLGLLSGAFLFNAYSPSLLPGMQQKDLLHTETLSTLLGVSPVVIIGGLALIWILFVLAVRKIESV
ncbi:MAG: YeeE/YedE family protein [Chlamydiia bacterium]|nr:YeeE/YedE family protein [Chlamydiia bacterium]